MPKPRSHPPGSCRFQLRPFGGQSVPPGLALSGLVARSPGKLYFNCRSDRGAEAVEWPPPSTACRGGHDLWQRTCFEIFFAKTDQDGYWEGNFSPSGRWNLYRFCGYRQGRVEETRVSPPCCSMERHGDGYQFGCSLDVAFLVEESRPLEVAVCCVIAGVDGRISHWASLHPVRQPDFHDRRGFCLHLPAMTNSVQEGGK